MKVTKQERETLYLLCARGAALNVAELASSIDTLLGNGETDSEWLNDRLETLQMTVAQLLWACLSLAEPEGDDK